MEERSVALTSSRTVQSVRMSRRMTPTSWRAISASFPSHETSTAELFSEKA